MEVLRKRGWEWKSATHYFIVKAGAGPHLAAGGCCRPQVRLPSESKGAASGTVEPPVASSNSSATLTGARLSAVASADARLPEARESRDAAGSTAGSPEVTTIAGISRSRVCFSPGSKWGKGLLPKRRPSPFLEASTFGCLLSVHLCLYHAVVPRDYQYINSRVLIQ